MTRDRPFISLCMIARDAERDLARALDSAASFVDEAVVVDTGSLDGTIRVARERGARVIERPWRHDFALHRNQSLAAARGEWLLVMDADEELHGESGPRLAPVCRAAEADCLFIEIRHLAAGGGPTVQWTPRLFRSGRGIGFTGAIHERLTGGDGRAQRAPLTLVHHGFAVPPEALAAKAARNLEILRRWAAREPRDPEPRAYLAQTLAGDPGAGPEALREALESARLAIALAGPEGIPPARIGHFHHPLIMALTRLGDAEGVLAAAGECLALAPDLPDPLFSLVWANSRLGRWEDACLAAERFQALQARWAARPLEYPYSHNRSVGETGRVCLWWLAAAARLGDAAAARRAAAGLLAAPGGEALAAGAAGLLADRPQALALLRQALAAAGGAPPDEI